MESLKRTLEKAKNNYPFPIASACNNYLNNSAKNDWEDWEKLSRDILSPILKILSHILLSDLVYMGKKPPHLYHRIESILSRPMTGHYAGFLRETTKFYKDNELDSKIPEMIDFLYRAEIKKDLHTDGNQLIGT